MKRHLPPSAKLLAAILGLVVLPVGALWMLTLYLLNIVGTDIEQKVETTLNLAINMEETLLGEGLLAMEHMAAGLATDPTVAAALASGMQRLDLQRFVQAFPRADMLLVVDRQGIVRARSTSGSTGDRFVLDGLVLRAMEEGAALAYPSLIGPDELRYEGQAIRDQVDMLILETGRSSDPRPGQRVDTALALVGVAPVRDANGAVIGATIAADVLNRDNRIVDEVARRSPEGVPMYATIAMDAIRVTTNVRLTDSEGNLTEHRALGTIYSDAVMEALRADREYKGRAVVVERWQRTIYRPLKDYQGNVIAGPYVGIPEEYFTGLSSRLRGTVQAAAAAGAVALVGALLVAYWLTRRAVRLRVAEVVGQVQHVSAVMIQAAEQFRASVDEACGAAVTAVSAGRSLQAVERQGANAEETISRVRDLEQAVAAIAEGARYQERAVRYTGRIVEEICATVETSREALDRASAGVRQLTAGARTGLKVAAELTAGVALIRQEMPEGKLKQQASALLRDPSELLSHMAALAERLAGEVRMLDLTVQENQARLSFIKEEMARVGAVVESTAESTLRAGDSVAAVAGWMELMAGSTAGAIQGAGTALSALEAIATSRQEMQTLSGQIIEQARLLKEAAERVRLP